MGNQQCKRLKRTYDVISLSPALIHGFCSTTVGESQGSEMTALQSGPSAHAEVDLSDTSPATDLRESEVARHQDKATLIEELKGGFPSYPATHS